METSTPFRKEEKLFPITGCDLAVKRSFAPDTSTEELCRLDAARTEATSKDSIIIHLESAVSGPNWALPHGSGGDYDSHLLPRPSHNNKRHKNSERRKLQGHQTYTKYEEQWEFKY
eukprot:5437023-Amphidinium_carterae.1